jgi:archaetidylinositol phosphate synthase
LAESEIDPSLKHLAANHVAICTMLDRKNRAAVNPANASEHSPMPGILLKRWNEGLLRPLEQPALAFLAARIPRWVTPDQLTILGVAGAGVTAVAYAFSGAYPILLWVATLGLIVNWIGDSLDGTLARLRGIERLRYGYYLDNAIDCFVALPVAAGLGLSGYIRFDVCFLCLAVYTMISALTFLRANVTDVFQISYGGAGPTEMRAATAILTAAIFFHRPQPFDIGGIVLQYPDVIALAWCASAIVTFLLSMTAQVRELAREEPPRQVEPSNLADGDHAKASISGRAAG